MKQAFFQKIEKSSWFHGSIVVVILFAAAIAGLQTYPDIEKEHGLFLNILDDTVLALFILELFVKVGARGGKPWEYFKDPWNIFDFSIIVIGILPFESSFFTVLRLARLLRVLKLIRALPELQLIVGALLKSIPSMFYIFTLLFLHFYIYSVIATILYGANDPIHFRNLQVSMLSLFGAATLENWTAVMQTNMYGSDLFGYSPEDDLLVASFGVQRISSASPFGAAMFFGSFIISGSMIVLNLFIGVIMNGMEEMKKESELERLVVQKEEDNLGLKEEIDLLRTQLLDINKSLETIGHRIAIKEKNSAGLKSKKPERSIK